MNTEQEKDEQLIRWLEGDLSGAELAAFESSPEFKDYQRIAEESGNLPYPTMDENAVFKGIKAKISEKENIKEAKVASLNDNNQSSKVIPLKKWILAIASIAVLALAVTVLLPSSTSLQSEVGQFMSHTLPDGSEININGNSQIKYNDNFEKNRTLELDGEAFFSVKKGETFTVKTNKGTVAVLGTSFNIFSRNDLFVVSCKTGKVKVESHDKSYILQKGDAVRIENGTSKGKESILLSKIASWIEGESYFSSASLEEVTLSMSSIYDVNIHMPSKYRNKRFTGSFMHNDIEKALKMVFSPMEISYSRADNGDVVLGE